MIRSTEAAAAGSAASARPVFDDVDVVAVLAGMITGVAAAPPTAAAPNAAGIAAPPPIIAGDIGGAGGNGAKPAPPG
ncbi:hypothetical protein XV03_11305 [Mycobacterium avium subsp. hominissuis]|uniref:Uncharacterized protein n=1 Tax=Mycobacterium avium subsp. hominissuis TaxID=439334 RepID=A0A2A3L907_MYCAV|nr:hypothetical protein XV03_11305 [Mycobacterium avium subsp. hominissuis]